MVAVAAVVMPVIVVPAATPAPTSSSPTSIVPWLRLLTVRVVASIVPLKMGSLGTWISWEAALRSAIESPEPLSLVQGISLIVVLPLLSLNSCFHA